MSETNPSYPTMELAISCETMIDLESGHERKKPGDIIVVREAGSYIGRREMARYIWLRVEGLEENEFPALMQMEVDPEDSDPLAIYDKRRYCIPFSKLAEIDPDFDADRAADPSDVYQPYLVVDAETGLYLIQGTPFDVSGLVYDKHTGEYL